MELTIQTPDKISTFKNVFELLKKSTQHTRISFKREYMYLQGMDRCNIALYELKLPSDWFSSYHIKEEEIVMGVDLGIFQVILALTQQPNQTLRIWCESGVENLNIAYTGKDTTATSTTFEIPLMDLDYDYLEIPETDYSVRCSISCKLIGDMIKQLAIFGDSIHIKTTDTALILAANSIEKGKMETAIPFESFNEYEIEEDATIQLCFSISSISKMISSNVAHDIQISMTNENPIHIKYALGDGYLSFYCAPKIAD